MKCNHERKIKLESKVLKKDKNYKYYLARCKGCNEYIFVRKDKKNHWQWSWFNLRKSSDESKVQMKLIERFHKVKNGRSLKKS